MKFRAPLGNHRALAAAAIVFSMQPLFAATVTLDGTSGSQAYNVPRSTDGGLTIGLEFQMEYLLVGGGGGGGGAAGSNSGGGGGGEVLAGSASGITSQSYSVTVGSGGTGGSISGTLAQSVGSLGGNSGLSGTGLSLTALGGGGGAGALGFSAPNVLVANATTGATGGGGSSQASPTQLGLAAAGTAGKGFAGGSAIGHSTDSTKQSGGGGGGAGGAGVAGTSTQGGAGGVGLSSSITGTSLTYGGGGGGGKRATGSAGVGGAGGGGAGSLGGVGSAGTANTGGGGGGSGENGVGGNGGSGVVIVRYRGTEAGTGGSITQGTGSASGYTLHTFTTTGSNTLNLSGLNLNTRLGAVESGVISGAGNLTLNGPGKLTLNGANTYTGRTIVSGGALALGANGSISNSSGVSVASGAVFDVSAKSGGFTVASGQSLSGGGTVIGNTTIAGAHTPGFSPGLQTFSGNLAYAAGSSITWELADDTDIGRGSSWDAIDVTGNLNFTGPTSLLLNFNSQGSLVSFADNFWSSALGMNGGGWKLFDLTGSGSVTGLENLTITSTSNDSTSASFATARPGQQFSLYEYGGDVYLTTVSSIPEPASILGLAGVLSGGLMLRRRKRA